MGAPRHSWFKLRVHQYICRKCATCKENVQRGPAEWIAIWHLPDGTKTTQPKTPPCQPGRLTEMRLQHYAAQMVEAQA